MRAIVVIFLLFVYSCYSATVPDNACIAVWSCSGCTGSITVNSVSGANAACTQVPGVYLTDSTAYIMVASTATNQFYQVACSSPANAACSELVVGDANSPATCVLSNNNADTLRTDNSVATFGCSGTQGACAFTSAPSTSNTGIYYYDVKQSGAAGGTAGTTSSSATSPDCVCENTSPPEPTCTTTFPCPCTSFTQGNVAPTPSSDSGKRSESTMWKVVQRSLIKLNATHPERIPETAWSVFF